MRSLYSAYHARVQGLDELAMCVMRLRYKLAHEPDIPNQNYIITPGRLQVTKMSLQSDRIVAVGELKNKESQLSYLKNLTEVQTRHDGVNPDTCPICVTQLGTEWAVFKCGHCFCLACVAELQNSATRVKGEAGFKCPYCRLFTRTRVVLFRSGEGDCGDSSCSETRWSFLLHRTYRRGARYVDPVVSTQVLTHVGIDERKLLFDVAHSSKHQQL